jgi:hypothetical protein
VTFTEHYTQKTYRILFLGAHGMFWNIDHILGHKTNLNELQNIKIISLSDREVKQVLPGVLVPVGGRRILGKGVGG